MISSPTRSGNRPNYKWELLALLCFAFFFHQGDRAIYGVVLPLIKEDLGLTDGQLGLVGTVLFCTLALLIPIAGFLCDVWNRQRIIVYSLLFWSVATAVTGLASGIVGLILFRSIATAGGESFYSPAAHPLIASYHTRTRTLALSIHQAALYVGVMVSGFIGGFIAVRWGWRATFFVFGAGGILLGFIMLWRLQANNESGEKSEAPEDKAGGDRGVSFLRTPSAWLMTVGFTAIVFVNNGYVVWAPTFLHERFSLSLTTAGGYSMLFHHLAALFGVLTGGWLSDRLVVRFPVARPVIMATGMFLGVPFIYLMGSSTNLVHVCCSMAAFGFARGLYESNTYASLFQVVHARRHASAVGIMSMIAFLVGSTSPLLLGKLSEASGEESALGWGLSLFSLAYVVGGIALALVAAFTFRRDQNEAL